MVWLRRLSLVVTATCLLAIGVALLNPWTRHSEWLFTILFSLFAAAYVLVGGLVSARRPDHPVGWLMLTIGALLTMPLLLAAYAGYPPGERPWLYVPAVSGTVLLILVFPRGHLVGQFRRWTARIVCVAGAVVTVAPALVPGPTDDFGTVSNPLGVETVSNQLETVISWCGAVIVATLLMALGSIFVRLRGATGDERQQLKWFAYATVLMVVAGLPSLVPVGLEETRLGGLVGPVVAFLALPVAIAVAILQHRLFDIDLIIKRTLVYGSLTLLLAGTYLGLVLGLREVVDPLAGRSDLEVAVSTLVVAALFRPLRSRIQGVVDRRFFRSRYDSADTVASFTGRLRQELDLEAVRAALCQVVHETVQPHHVSLWVRDVPQVTGRFS